MKWLLAYKIEAAGPSTFTNVIFSNGRLPPPEKGHVVQPHKWLLADE